MKERRIGSSGRRTGGISRQPCKSIMKHMKSINRILSFLAVICCLAGSILPSYSARASEVSNSDTPRVVFTNEPNPLPGLRVTKAITNPEDYTEGGQPLFSFTLKLDDKTLTKEMSYKKKDSSGNIITDAQGNEITYWTEDHGVFELGAGETAWFKDIEAGRKYEVEENKDGNGKCECVKLVVLEDGTEETREELEGSFRQKLPESNANAVGHITSEGAVETFENEYTPAGEGEKTTLHISKSTPFLSGYTSPETLEFTFIIKIKGKSYANEPFSIVDAQNGSIGTDATDGNGQFKLQVGHTAEFAGIDAEADYEVREITEDMPEGWWPIGDTVKDGAAEAGDMWLNFSNGNASFAVSKEMKGNSGQDVDFAFELTGEDGSLWRQAKYYLYNISDKKHPLPVETKKPEDTKKPADTEQLTEAEQSEDKEQQVNYVHMTGDDGRFTLKPGQIAVFIGIRPETKFNVREIPNPAWENEDWWKKGDISYRQITPENKDGYIGQETSNSVLPLEFENEAVKYTSTLSVMKLIENLKNDAPEDLDTREFQFVLESRSLDASGNGTGEFQPVENADFDLMEGGKETSGRTGEGEDNGGKFNLKANATAIFKSLERNKEYQVREITEGLAEDGYCIKDDSAQTGILKKNSNNNVTFAFTNQYSADKLDLNLTKVNRAKPNETQKKLAGAEFTLWKVKPEALEGTSDGDLTWKDTEGEGKRTKVGSYTTDTDRKLTIPGLGSGTYFLEETKPPAGYIVFDVPLKIVIARQYSTTGADETMSETLTVTVDGEEVSTAAGGKLEAGVTNGVSDNLTDPGKMVAKLTLIPGNNSDPDGNTRDTVELTAYDNLPYDLPSSGGIGIFPIIVAGIACMMAAIFLYWKRIRVQKDFVR